MIPYLLSVAQLQSSPFVIDLNRAKILKTVEEAFKSGSRIMILPELCVTGYAIDHGRLKTCAEPVNGITCPF